MRWSVSTASAGGSEQAGFRSPDRPLNPGGSPEQRVLRERRVITRDGTALAVSDWAGPSTDRTVVFLHGLCLSQAAWAIQARHVLGHFDHRTRVISYDHRGHGDSGSAPLHTYRVGQLAADLDDVLTALKTRGPLVLVGHSMGAMTALTYLAEGGCAAQVAGVVLCATAAGHLAMQGIGRLLGLPVLDMVIDTVARVPTRAAGALTAPMRVVLHRAGALGGARGAALAEVFANALESAPLSTALGFLTSLRDFDQTPNLSSITAQTTIISGGLDLLTPPALSREMASAIAGSTHVHLPAAGHMLPQQEPNTVNDAVTAVVESAVARQRCA
jgi:pimeloyl-ACP methyl ester carboxylesterase